ncbi:TorF family putative porin [Pseudomonas sp. EA_35y_Pfl2_R5]|uniref:TorF family putative porin n=1 Tax=Pseudomonas sp. EA_35y_Pfl2_R5 TaxID=3088690 RepID=UPI0030D74F34
MRVLPILTLASLTLQPLCSQAVELNDQFALLITPKVVSDYRSDGVSQTLGDPAAQLDVMLSHVSGAYLGAWTSHVNFGYDWENDDNYGTRQEVDYYAGYYWQINDHISLDTMYSKYTYPGESQFNSSDIIVTLEAYGAYVGGKYSVDTDDDKLNAYIGYRTQLPLDVALDARYGNVDYKDDVLWNEDFSRSRQRYDYWQVDLTRDLIGVTWGLSYIDTDQSKAECLNFSGYDDLCGPTVVASASKTF